MVSYKKKVYFVLFLIKFWGFFSVEASTMHAMVTAPMFANAVSNAYPVNVCFSFPFLINARPCQQTQSFILLIVTLAPASFVVVAAHTPFAERGNQIMLRNGPSKKKKRKESQGSGVAVTWLPARGEEESASKVQGLCPHPLGVHAFPPGERTHIFRLSGSGMRQSRSAGTGMRNPATGPKG